jgi:four helix bundle protein
MAKMFEELQIWQKARELVKAIYKITMSDKFKKDYSLLDQIRRSSVSVMSNIAEGFERGSNTEFVQFLYIAKGSAGEVRTQLYIAYDLKYIDDQVFESASRMSIELSKGISRFINYLKKSKIAGEKYKP